MFQNYLKLCFLIVWKLSYICNFGIAPYAKNILIKKVQETSYYAFSFDESFNAQLQKTQMDIIVRFFDDKKLKVINQYLTSEFLKALLVYFTVSLINYN